MAEKREVVNHGGLALLESLAQLTDAILRIC